MTDKHFHVVCTPDEASTIIGEHAQYWVSNCGCREEKGCNRSRIDVCLFFDTQMGGTGSHFREVDQEFVEGILKEAEDTHLVARPFRYQDDKTRIQGICFCCDDCCYYFVEPSAEPCDKGAYIEKTNDECTHCGSCVDVCYFDARTLKDDTLAINRDNCYGCGLCVEVCPADCIHMVKR